MAADTQIPIKNIYCMLCYSWDTLPVNADKLCGNEKFDNIYNLMARILIMSVKQLLRRGFHREYITAEEPLSLLRGRIDFQQSINKQVLMQRQLVCSHDDMSPDVPFNQIIKATLNVLIKYKELNNDLRKDLVLLRYSFMNIADILPTRHTFSALRYNKNNQNYKLMINVSRLVFDGLVSNEDNNQLKFADFLRDKHMAALYEKFVLNFYKLHLSKNDYHVHAPKIAWDIRSSDVSGIEYLPEMRTDIVLENKHSNTQLIIDTKFYSELFAQQNYGIQQKLHSSNLYQIYTYVGNSSYKGNIMGMLLYPTTKEDLDINYVIGNKSIMIRTLNLGLEWEQIEKSLLGISELLL